MNALYITSVEPYSGKTAVALALGRQLQSDNYEVGYLKPVSTQPWRTPQGKLADEDAVFIGGARIIKPNIEASNGIIHVVDNVVYAIN